MSKKLEDREGWDFLEKWLRDNKINMGSPMFNWPAIARRILASGKSSDHMLAAARALDLDELEKG